MRSLLLLLALTLSACDPGAGRDRVAPRDSGQGTGDLGLPDLGGADGGVIADLGSSDLGALDLGFGDGGRTDAGADLGSPDAGTVDMGRPGPIACTPATAGAVCGGRPCVDGFCCDNACGGPCESCAVTGLEGACTVVGGIPCDDGDACTYGEMCASDGTCGGGSSLSCDGMDTACRDFSCNGTPTCSSSPRNVGGACDDGNGATSGDMCRPDGTCMGTVGSGCTLPTDACTNGSQSRDGCGNARIIGRGAARTGFSTTGDTCSARNRFDDCSWDAGNDHAYRIWMRAGESIAVSITKTNTCFTGWASTLKLYESTGCSDITCNSDRWCNDFVSNGETFNHVASRDGWVVVVVDGSTAFDDEGRYTLNLTLSGCASATCEC